MTVENYREAFKLASTQSGKESEGIDSKQRSQTLATRKHLWETISLNLKMALALHGCLL